MKRLLFTIGGILWLLFALGIGLFLIEYVDQGAGLQIFGGLFFGSGTILMGWLHVVGLCVAIVLCLSMAAWLFAHGWVRGEKNMQQREQ